MADDLDWWAKKMGGIPIGNNPKSIRSMTPGQTWVNPNYEGSAKFINDAEQVRPRGITLHNRDEELEPLAYVKGGKVIKSEKY